MLIPPDMHVWTGRVDEPRGPDTARWHQIIKPWDNASTPRGPAFAFIGFRCDEGVRRNQGRPGAAEGPAALRRSLSNLPCHLDENIRLFDAGDVACENCDLETAQDELAEAVREIAASGCVPIVLGGGHETAFGHHQGLRAALSNGKRRELTREVKLGIVNFDAHFDLRPYPDGPHSGSPFLQIADSRSAAGEPFSYLCLGIQSSANTKALFRTARELGVAFVPGSDLHVANLPAVTHTVDEFLSTHDAMHLTFCLDVFAAAFAPGVSAPTPHGIFPDTALALVRHLAASGKAVGFDIAELSPTLDQDSRTAKLAAAIVFEFVTSYKF